MEVEIPLEANVGKVERAIEEVASRCAEESEYIAELEKTEMVEELVKIRRRKYINSTKQIQ